VNTRDPISRDHTAAHVSSDGSGGGGSGYSPSEDVTVDGRVKQLSVIAAEVNAPAATATPLPNDKLNAELSAFQEQLAKLRSTAENDAAYATGELKLAKIFRRRLFKLQRAAAQHQKQKKRAKAVRTKKEKRRNDWAAQYLPASKGQKKVPAGKTTAAAQQLAAKRASKINAKKKAAQKKRTEDVKQMLARAKKTRGLGIAGGPLQSEVEEALATDMLLAKITKKMKQAGVHQKWVCFLKGLKKDSLGYDPALHSANDLRSFLGYLGRAPRTDSSSSGASDGPESTAASQDQRRRGTVSTWKSTFGFIRPFGGGPNVFCHCSKIADGNSLREGAIVTFMLSVGQDGRPCALSVSSENQDVGSSSSSGGGDRGQGGSGANSGRRGSLKRPAPPAPAVEAPSYRRPRVSVANADTIGTSPGQHRCAAGDDCVLPTLPVPALKHLCFGCRAPMHGTCGLAAPSGDDNRRICGPCHLGL
jgi:cold shock CspA family protein